MADRLIVEELLQVRQAVTQALRRWRHEGRACRRGTTDPVLRAAYLARGLADAATVRHQLGVHLVHQPGAQGQAALEQGQAVFECRDVAGHLAHVVQRHAGGALGFVEHQVRQGRLRALDLRGHHRLLANVAVEEH